MTAAGIREVCFAREDLLKKNLIYAAGAMAAAGPAAGDPRAVNAMMIGNNLVNVLSNNPISAQPVIDAGVAYIRNHPKSENASEVYTVLAMPTRSGACLTKQSISTSWRRHRRKSRRLRKRRPVPCSMPPQKAKAGAPSSII
jgi:hypothetical protein